MDDFDKLLKSAKEKNPSEFQMKKWKRSVWKRDQKTQQDLLRMTKTRYWGQMLAAVLVGIVVGGLFYGDLGLNKKLNNQEIADEDATIEVVYTKL